MITFSSRIRFVAELSLLLALLFVLPACRDASQGTITGKAKLENEPLTSAIVYFVYADGQSRHSLVGLDGSYRIEKVPVGIVKIKIETYSPVPPAIANAQGPNAKNEHKKIPPAVKILAKYNDAEKSGLSFDVKPGEQPHDILLKK
jgi:hypothetical protein